MLPYLYAENLGDISHGFFGVKGGASSGDYTSLNCGFSTTQYVECPDVFENIIENRRRIVQELASKETILQTLSQVHGTKVIIVGQDGEIVPPDFPKADGLVTNDTGVMLGVLTADCAPVLFCDNARGVIGAAHAGWRGAFAGIVKETVEQMTYLGAKLQDIHMSVGPCIQQQSYEVDSVFHQEFVAQGSDNCDFFLAISGKEDRWLFDLSGYIKRQGATLNLSSVSIMSEDTYTQGEAFFSHRRHMTVHGHGRCGRQLSVITL